MHTVPAPNGSTQETSHLRGITETKLDSHQSEHLLSIGMVAKGGRSREGGAVNSLADHSFFVNFHGERLFRCLSRIRLRSQNFVRESELRLQPACFPERVHKKKEEVSPFKIFIIVKCLMYCTRN